MVISLKKYLDLDLDELKKCAGPDSADIAAATLELYRSALLTFGDCGSRACPPSGVELRQGLMRILARLPKEVTLPVLQDMGEHVDQELQQWGERSSEYLRQKVHEIRDVLILLTRTTETMSQRDQHYSTRFTSFTERLQDMADLEDLPRIRASLVQSARELKDCVHEMEEAGRESAALLKAEVLMYQKRLEEAEQRASRDPLTGLDNRFSIESIMGHRIEQGRPFSIALLDLNGFKQVNDSYGHLAGDDLLKQFATEMRSLVRATDVVGRWGGDEFIAILDCSLDQAEAYIERQKRWLFGEYTIQAGGMKLKVNLSASIGLVQWQNGETMADLVARADTAMYKDKPAARKETRE